MAHKIQKDHGVVTTLEDGSVIYSLVKPIDALGGIATQVSIRRMTFKDWKQSNKKSGEARDTQAIQSLCTVVGLEHDLLDDTMINDMDMSDRIGITKVISGFLLPPIGKN